MTSSACMLVSVCPGLTAPTVLSMLMSALANPATMEQCAATW